MRHALDTIRGKTVGFIDNAKPNFDHLVDDLAEAREQRHLVGGCEQRAAEHEQVVLGEPVAQPCGGGLVDAVAQIDAGDLGAERLMDAPGEIAMTDDAVAAVRSRTDTSVHGAVTAVREGTADAWVSIGHTGAVLTAATLTLGRLHGVTRAAVAVVIPGTAHDVVLLDVGGSLDVSAEVLAQFGELGRAYAIALGLNAAPRVGLLSIGTEPGKGDALRKEADALLRTADVGYVGFVEGRDIAAGGPADVIVVDGFTGNVVLKALEGAAVNVAHALAKVTGEKEAASVVAANYLSGSKAGAVLLGVNGITVLGHGGSTADEVGACIDLAVRLARHDLVGRTRQLLSGGS